MKKIAVSILTADFSRLGEVVREIEANGCDELHIDVMDGHFVPNLTMGPMVVRSIRPVTTLPFDVHLMLAEPMRYMEQFVKAGADSVTVHAETLNTDELIVCMKQLHAWGVRSGISIKPGTPVSVLGPVLAAGEVDRVLVMTVEPGFGGQHLLPETLDTIRELHAAWPGVEIQVDGGIDRKTMGSVMEAGATVMVWGTAYFKTTDRKQLVEMLHSMQ